ncbi:MAG: hypothetical protein IJ881_00285 [Neisseriaceae bacterium]|nr:hypothetical protein [Neisseriaceae bacterium]
MSNDPHNYDDLFEVEEKDGKHPLNQSNSSSVAILPKERHYLWLLLWVCCWVLVH